MSLRHSYTALASVYDLVAAPAFRRARSASLAALPQSGSLSVLIDGVGTGLDLRYLPRCHRYTALDITRAMLRRALPRAEQLDMSWAEGDSMALPFHDASFDYVVLHLIVAVVPDPVRALQEAARVTRPGGMLLLMDKFLQPGALAPIRRLLSPLAGRIATRTDVVFEDVFRRVTGLKTISDRPALAGGWFRAIQLQRV